MKQRKYLIYFSLAILLFVPVLVFALTGGEGTGTNSEILNLNTQIEEKKQKIKEIEDSISKFQNKIDQKRLEAVSLSNQMDILDNRIVQVELDIKMIQEKLDILNLEIEQLQISITEKKTNMERQKALVAEMLRNLHQNTGKGYIEILATYDSFSDFYNELQYLQSVQEDLGQSVTSLRLAKVDLESKKTQTENRRKIYEETDKELQEKKKDLEEQNFGKETLLAQTQATELSFKSLVNNLRKQYQAEEAEIQSIEQEVRKKLESQNKIDDSQNNNNVFLLTWPVPSKYITAYFHDPDYPYRHIFEHNAIDLRATQGTSVRATAAGYVARARVCYSSTCYSYIVLVHSGGFSTVYGHLSGINVTTDQFVAKGDIIGYSGGTPGTIGAGPFVTGPHLHFELRKNGIPVNPLAYLPN
jgi:murein DD-endopeptidase MepM/ murein hydrolase activator NlpD